MLQKTQLIFLLKNIVLTIQIQNRQCLKNLQRLTANFDKKKKSQPRKHKKIDLNCSNRYEYLYITDSNTESESEDSDDITITDTLTDNNTQTGYTHRIYQRNDDLKEVNKPKSKITEYMNRGNDIRIRNVKQTSTSRLQ